MHTSNYLWSVLKNCLGPDKDGLEKLNENVNLWKVSKQIKNLFFLFIFYYDGVILDLSHAHKCSLAPIYDQFSKTA